MRITFLLPPPNLSGGIRVLAIYAERLHKRGHHVQVISFPKSKKSLRSQIKSWLTGSVWRESGMVEQSHFDGLSVPHRRLVSENPDSSEFPDADVVLATFWRTGPVVADLPPSKGVKAIFLQGYETSPGFEEPDIDAVWRLPLRKIVISDWMINLSKDRFGDADVVKVPNAVDMEQFYAPPRDKQKVPTVGILYGSIHLKGLDITSAALEQVRSCFPDLRIVAFGSTPVQLTVPLPDNAEYYLRPPQNQIRDLYAQCDVWVCGSRREGFHLPPLEAMACRCPVVSTRVGGPSDIIEDGKNGFLVDVEDTAALATKITKVLEMNNADWRKMSEAAYETASRYSWDDATTLLENALAQISRDEPFPIVG
jgi:glycosyltransferase involved in cell wall biosynthesis